MTTLTKQLRLDIINSVITKGTKLPKMKADLKKRTEAKVRKICLARVPKEFAAAVKNLPAEWFPHIASTSINQDVNPLNLMDASEEVCRRSRLWGSYISFESIKHPINARFDRTMNARSYNETKDNPESWEILLADEIAEAKAIWAKEEKARTDLGNFLASVRTYKQALEKMPELEGHLPVVAGKPYPVSAPVGPLVKMLTGLGFDQSAP